MGDIAFRGTRNVALLGLNASPMLHLSGCLRALEGFFLPSLEFCRLRCLSLLTLSLFEGEHIRWFQIGGGFVYLLFSLRHTL